MSIILLADDSPHAQRMGERILLDEGFEVVSVTNGETALLRMTDVDPDLVIADVFLPGRSGFEICRAIKSEYRHVRVILTAGLLEPFDEDEARRAGCDAILKKPFEASLVMQTIRPLVHDAQLARGLFAEAMVSARPSEPPLDAPPQPLAPARLPIRSVWKPRSRWRSTPRYPALVREITEKVLVALGH